MSKPLFENTKKEADARLQASNKNETKAIQKGRVSNSRKTAEKLLLNQSKTGVSYGGGKKTKRQRHKKNKTKKRHAL